MKALQKAGWDVVRAIDALPQGAADLQQFERAVRLGRVLVTNDDDQKEIAIRWYLEGRPFAGLVWWPQQQYRTMRPRDVVQRFEEYAAQDEPFAAYPIVHLKPPRP